MVAAARVVGLLLLGYAGAGLALTWLSIDPTPLPPLWDGQPWTAAARRAADWAAYLALVAGGAALRLEPKHALWPLALAVLVVAAMVGYDVLAADPDAARQRAMLQEDIALAGAAAIGLFATALALDEEADEDAADT